MSNLASLASCNGLAQWRNFRSNARKLPTKCGPNVHKSGRKSHKRILDIGRDPSVSAFSRDYRRRHNNPSFCHVGENINRHGDHRLEVLGIDLTGPHVVISRGNKHIVTIIDHFSRYVEAIPVGNQEASTVARVLVDTWISRYGCPLQILTDQGACFEAALFKDLCRLLGVSRIRTSGYTPSTNGAIERFHWTLNSILAKFISENQKDWDIQLPVLMCAYRASQHTSTGYSPNKLFLNRELYLLLDLVLGECLDREQSTRSRTG